MRSRMNKITQRTLIVVLIASAAAGCSGGGSVTSGTQAGVSSPGEGAPGLVLTQTTAGVVPSGSITRYGAINVADDAGQAADVVAGFFNLQVGLSASVLDQLFASSSSGDSNAATQANCQVFETPKPTLFDLSGAYLPELVATGAPIELDGSITLRTQSLPYALLEFTDVGEFTFYSLPINERLPEGEVPTDLSVMVADGSERFGGDFGFEPVDPLQGFTYADQPGPVVNTQVFSDSRFTWTPSGKAGQWIRIETQTAGGFFLDESQSIKCVVPDSGMFTFPASVTSELGGDFSGAKPMVSRLSIKTQLNDTTALFLIRESFLTD